MHLNLDIDSTISVTIRDKEYPVAVAGNGIPCLSIGQGTFGQLTLSKHFKHYFKIYSSNLYFDKEYALDNPSTLTMDRMIDDIKELGDQLGLTQYVLFGFSAFGIITLEFAKKYPDLVAGIIMVGTPPNSNQYVAARNNAYFESHAEPERKALYAYRRAEVAKEDLSKLDYSAKILRTYVYRDAPLYWHNPDFDCSEIWHHIQLDEATNIHLFTDVLPKIDVMKGLEKIQCPIFLAAGLSDYNCCPFIWKEVKNLPPTYDDC